MTEFIYKQGDMLEEVDRAIILINAVNCVGVMGAGLAKQFKDYFGSPYFENYKLQCEQGYIHVNVDDHSVRFPIFPISSLKQSYIYNFPTKDDWRHKSEYSYIDNGLNRLRRYIEYHLYTVRRNDDVILFIPPLGCGLGGLDRSIVENKIKTKLNDINNLNVWLWNFK